jgi:hypothetical protein
MLGCQPAFAATSLLTLPTLVAQKGLPGSTGYVRVLMVLTATGFVLQACYLSRDQRVSRVGKAASRDAAF